MTDARSEDAARRGADATGTPVAARIHRVSIAMEAPSSPMLDDRTIEARPSRV
jgi:hypothetical protein